MAEVMFEPRYALRSVRDPDLAWLRDLIIEPCNPERDFGEALVTFRDGT